MIAPDNEDVAVGQKERQSVLARRPHRSGPSEGVRGWVVYLGRGQEPGARTTRAARKQHAPIGQEGHRFERAFTRDWPCQAELAGCRIVHAVPSPTAAVVDEDSAIEQGDSRAGPARRSH